MDGSFTSWVDGYLESVVGWAGVEKGTGALVGFGVEFDVEVELGVGVETGV